MTTLTELQELMTKFAEMGAKVVYTGTELPPSIRKELYDLAGEHKGIEFSNRLEYRGVFEAIGYANVTMYFNAPPPHKY